MDIEKSNKQRIKNIALHERPREKMMLHGAASLSYTELLAIIIGSGNQKASAIEIGKKLLDRVNNSLSDLGRLTLKDLRDIHGIGEARAFQLCAALELGRRRREEEARKLVKITNSQNAFEYLLPNLEDIPHEEFWILVLNRNNLVLTKKRISIGGVSGTVVDPRIIFKIALEHLASGIVLCHNHPSGNLSPSNQDVELTRKMVSAGKFLDIHIIDHLIIGNGNYYSFCDQGLLKAGENN